MCCLVDPFVSLTYDTRTVPFAVAAAGRLCTGAMVPEGFCQQPQCEVRIEGAGRAEPH
mgnify:CR=1 FL=1